MVGSIRPPTVPARTSRIRLSLNCMHEEKDVIRLVDHIAEFIDEQNADPTLF